MKNLLRLYILILCFTFSLSSYAQSKGTVRDNNNGNQGYILIHSGTIQGSYNDIGTWTNAKDVPELKGNKGNTGEQGQQGIQGITGKDFNPREVKRLDNKIDNLNNRINELEETQYIIGIKGRIYDSKKFQVNIFADYSTNRNKIDRTGVRFTWKFGTSFEEREINKLKQK